MLVEHRKDLTKLNQEITLIEDKLRPEVEQSLKERLALKLNQLEEHHKVKPKVESKPDEVMTVEQKAIVAEVAEITTSIRILDEWLVGTSHVQAQIARDASAARDLTDRLNLLDKQVKQFVADTEASRTLLGLQTTDILEFEFKRAHIERASALAAAQKLACDKGQEELQELRGTLDTRLKALEQLLNSRQLIYQQSVQAMEAWEKKLVTLTGSEDDPDSKVGLEAHILHVESLPAVLQGKREKRRSITGEIYDSLDLQRKSREELFAPVQNLIASNRLIRDDYKLQFVATFAASPDALSDVLFSIIKQNTGDFRGDDKSRKFIQDAVDKVDFDKKAEVVALSEFIHDKLLSAAVTGTNGGVSTLLRKDRTATEVYDLLFGLDFITPRYSMRFQDTAIEQLSPGQRGALLLIFYLLVDKGQYPIVLDQPEENLDNQTVVSLLVPVIEQSKAKRQIIMVTHNPNLAVVCDAEQIIYSAFDRRDECTISYVSGAIEDPVLNRHVVDVLEGTMPAFSNRHMKYHED